MGQSLKDYWGGQRSFSAKYTKVSWHPGPVGKKEVSVLHKNVLQLSRSSVSFPDLSVILKTASLLLQLAGWCLGTLEVGLLVKVGPLDMPSTPAFRTASAPAPKVLAKCCAHSNFFNLAGAFMFPMKYQKCP